MGLSGIADFDNPELMELVTSIAKVAEKNKLLLAIQVYDLSKVQRLHDLGYQMFGVFDDQILFHQSLQRRFDKIAEIRDKLT